MPHASLGILNITLVAGNDMNMDMVNTLPGRWPNVNAYIVAIRLEFLIQQVALLGYQLHAGINLFRRQVKKAGDMTTWNDQGMALAYPVGVEGAVSQLILQ